MRESPFNPRHWFIYSLLALLSACIWFKLSFNHLAFINLSTDRHEALKISKEYLHKKGEDVSSFQKAIVFGSDTYADRYLQKTLGFEEEKKFLKTRHFDLFFWLIRFYKLGEKEEFILTVSSETGEVTSFKHVIDENAAREKIGREVARERVITFLKEKFHFEPDDYTPKADLEQTFDNRSDFSFSWQKKDVNIPWSEKADSGSAKLVIGATISGNEILIFSKNSLQIPDQFNRDIEIKNYLGRNIGVVLRILFYALFTSAVFFVITRRNHLAMHKTKIFYITLAGISFFLYLANILNDWEYTLYGLQTTDTFHSFLWRLILSTLLDALIINIFILIPGLSGELLHFENFKNKKEGGFFHYTTTTFLSKSAAEGIVFGYLACIIMLGLQAILFNLGQKYLGVWLERNWMVHLSGSYIPFLAAFTIAFKASLNEEIFYRLFCISLGKKFLKSTFWAAVLASSLWGFAHTGYPVYPMWFRGIEVSILGFFLSFIYLNFGILPVLVAHFLFDLLWGTLDFLVGQTAPIYFYSSVAVLSLPLLWAFLAFTINKKVEEKPIKWYLNKHQLYNLKVLTQYLMNNREEFINKNDEEIKKEIASHGWDIAVIEMALEEVRKKLNS